MSNLLSTAAVRGLTSSITLGTVILESLHLKNLLDVNFSNASIELLTSHPSAFYIRQDRKNKSKTVNVFNGAGEQVYTFERLSSSNPVWRMLTFPQRQEIATIKISFGERSINFHNKPRLNHRRTFCDWNLKGRHRSFYLNDGAKYSWSSSNKYLERIINPNGGLEEQRVRIAKVKLMRQFKLDFEVLVDETKIDADLVLATAFISIFTQWGFGNFTDTVGATYVPKASEETPKQ
ncbi:hypothetical protein KGF56_001404 [Candida oxycetoniae]|uniref:Uncharacterized protein n=1 Tax=Candida oxycetoniae TaxID=497107 RepID=A0AAI9WYY2_9ASCO|nr:uncharacterized protein KGF56_001404 [Candida oxycetoniae]KAI3405797.2 hypothetical protein KGF56_001404 [Candida oxycetoniae]